MLLMKKEFFAAIRAGRKTTTLRFWRRRRVRAGSVHTAPGLGKLRIEDVRPVDLAALSDADAVADGFPDAASLRKALERIYPGEARDGRTLYQVRFTLVAAGPARAGCGTSGESSGSARRSGPDVDEGDGG